MATKSKPLGETPNPTPKKTPAKKAAKKKAAAPRKRNVNESATPPGEVPEYTKGVLILALGSIHYGRMAANLAASIRFSDKNIPIHLVYSGGAISHLSEQHKALFTSIEHCPEGYMTKDGKVNNLKAKTFLYELSPFDETLFIDADVIWFGRKPVRQLMKELSVRDFDIQNRGYYDYKLKKEFGKYTLWVSPEAAQKAYGLTGRIYKLSSEVVYFKKTDKVCAFFREVQDIFDNPLVKSNHQFMGDIPDELAYNIASAKLKMFPAKEKRVFVYWENEDKLSSWQDALNQFYAYGVGGNNISPQIIARYESMAKSHSIDLGLPHFFKIYPKRTWDKTRITL